MGRGVSTWFASGLSVTVYRFICAILAELLRITGLLDNDLQHNTNRNSSPSPAMQVCLALVYFASGSFHNLVGDSVHVHKSAEWSCGSVSVHLNTYVLFPVQPAELNHVRHIFDQIAGFPNVAAFTECTSVS